MQDPVRVGPFAENGHGGVVSETPAGSRTKYTWDGDARAYRAGWVLPLGMVGSPEALQLVEEAKR